jgi:serine-type D-Ala-D-Ala carboxypeptidase (penicillin-binding protein 5/6)
MVSVQMTDSPLRIDQWFTVGLLVVVFSLEGSFQPVPKELLTPIFLPQIAMADVPVSTDTSAAVAVASPSSQLTAKSYIVVDLDSGAVLASHEPDKALYPASTTKMLTAMIAASTFSLDEVWELTAEDLIEYSTVGFQIGDKVQVKDVMAALLIQSDNAAAEALSRRFPGGKVGILTAMSRWASHHGMTHQIFIDPAGFDVDTQLVSARDLAIMAKELLKQPLLAELIAQPLTSITVMRQDNPRQLVVKNTNHLLTRFSDPNDLQVYGVKTGTTPAAGEVLVTAAKKYGKSIIVVVMGSQDRFTETTQLLVTTYQNYAWFEPTQLLLN